MMKKLLCTLTALVLLLLALPAFAAGTGAFRLVEMTADDGKSYGTLAVPSGFVPQWNFTGEGTYESVGNPIHLQAQSGSEEKAIFYLYESPRNFLEIIDDFSRTHQDLVLDMTTGTWMLRYEGAAGYADRKASGIAQNLGVTVSVLAEQDADPSLLRYMQSYADMALQRSMNDPALAISGVTITDTGYSYADRWYSFTFMDVPMRMRVVTCIFYTDMQGSVPGFINMYTNLRSWSVPAAWIAIYPEVYDTEASRGFVSFMDNTSVNARFLLTNMQLSGELRDTDSESNTFAFSDYIFDRNEYVTDSGERVKISTAYDYVWQDGSDVWYSDSALDMPADATRLYAR